MKRPTGPARPKTPEKSTTSHRRGESESNRKGADRSELRADHRSEKRASGSSSPKEGGAPAKAGNASNHDRGHGGRSGSHSEPRAKEGTSSASSGASHRGENRNNLAVGAVSARYLKQGHAWVTRDKELGDTSRFRNGSIAHLIGPEGEFLAQALLEPEARVVARVISRDPREVLSDDVIRQRALNALERRQALEATCTAYRIIHQEADGFPGLTVDRYGDYLVAQLYSTSALGLAHLALEAFERTGHFAGGFLKELPKDRRLPAEASGTWLFGQPGPSRFEIAEYGVKFWAAPFQVGAGGLSTGLFLDMRENRKLIADLSAGKRVLNAFSYTGGFSLFCAKAGAHVDTLDLSPRIIEQARENFALNQLDEDGHRFIVDDAFLYLARVAGKTPETTYDVIVLDPPTFSTSRENTWSPGRITELNALALATLPRNGLLVTFSNFAQMTEAEFLQAIFDASHEARRPVQVVQTLQSGPDFPWLPGFPESRHLKGFVLKVLS